MPSRAKRLIAEYLKSGRDPKWARRTDFKPLRGGKVRRTILRADGTVEKSDILAGPEWELAAARANTGLSQAQFARLLGVSKRTLEGWEQGRHRPSGAARALLRVALKRPEALLEALEG
jgi:putative transcriptional regulator